MTDSADDNAQNLRLLEALIFASATMLDEEGLAERLPDGVDVNALLAELAEAYANRGVNLVKLAGGWTFRTAPDLKDRLKIETEVSRKLSRAAVETLAIIAYHQPVTRAEIEAIRGVGLSKGTLDLLFEQGWIQPMGRRRAPGKPVTWGSTPYFLEHFGLGALDDLPGFDELKAAGLLDANANITVYRPEEGDLPLEPSDDEDNEPLSADEGDEGGAPANAAAEEGGEAEESDDDSEDGDSEDGDDEDGDDDDDADDDDDDDDDEDDDDDDDSDDDEESDGDDAEESDDDGENDAEKK